MFLLSITLKVKKAELLHTAYTAAVVAIAQV